MTTPRAVTHSAALSSPGEPELIAVVRSSKREIVVVKRDEIFDTFATDLIHGATATSGSLKHSDSDEVSEFGAYSESRPSTPRTDND